MTSYCCNAMTLSKLIIVIILIISTNFISVDSRALRKRRQFSSASYYIAGFNPYANSNVDPASLTYPSGPFYDPPKYIHSETLYAGGNGNTNLYGSSSLYGQINPSTYNMNPQYPGAFYGNNLYGYGPGGFSVRFPNWNQGNIAQYYTGGTGSGLSNTLNYWGRSLRPAQTEQNPMPMMMGPPMGR